MADVAPKAATATAVAVKKSRFFMVSPEDLKQVKNR
jgi:hypothetical protein